MSTGQSFISIVVDCVPKMTANNSDSEENTICHTEIIKSLAQGPNSLSLMVLWVKPSTLEPQTLSHDWIVVWNLYGSIL